MPPKRRGATLRGWLGSVDEWVDLGDDYFRVNIESLESLENLRPVQR